MVYGLVNQCRGAVTIDSKPGHGTTVAMFFPRASADMVARVEGSAIDAISVTPLRPGCKLLIVDDDADVREFAATALREAGYVVREAPDAEAGLKLLRQEPDIAVLVTDYAMPIMTGADLFRRGLAIRPDLAAVLITGFANLPSDDQALNAMHILRKPFDLPDLLRVVNQCLERVPAIDAAA
jgi:CheY-like chemotaxis protein